MNSVIWKLATGYPDDPYIDLTGEVEHSGDVPFYHQIQWQEELKTFYRITITDQITLMVSQAGLRLRHPIGGEFGADILNLTRNKKRVARFPSHFLLLPDEEDRLRQIVVQSREPRYAPYPLYAIGARIVSQMVYEHNVPMEIYERRWFSLRNGQVEVSVNYFPSIPTSIKLVDEHNAFQRPTHLFGNTLFARAVAHYREGLLISVPSYKFLALFKGCETIQQLSSSLHSKGYRFSRPSLDLPVVLRQEFPNLHNELVTVVVNQLLTEYRNLVAHIEIRDQQKTSTKFFHEDLFEGTIKYTKLAFIAEQAFRLMATMLYSLTETPN